MIHIPTSTQMITVSGPLTVGTDQITQLVAPASNPKGCLLMTLYTQVIQSTASPSNIAQSLIVAALTAPTSFGNKANCLPIWRTYQDGSQTAIAAGGGTPINLLEMELPAGWGIWQCLNVTNTALLRNNVRLGISFKHDD